MYLAIGAIAIVVIIVGVILSSAVTPNYAEIIENQDCNAALNLTESDLVKATIEQQLSLSTMIIFCSFGK